jgi:hypothetical protein
MSSDGGRLLMDLVAVHVIHGEYGKLSPTPSLAGMAVHFYQEKVCFSRLFGFQDFLSVVETFEDAAELEVTSVDFTTGDDIQRASDPECDH